MNRNGIDQNLIFFHWKFNDKMIIWMIITESMKSKYVWKKVIIRAAIIIIIISRWWRFHPWKWWWPKTNNGNDKKNKNKLIILVAIKKRIFQLNQSKNLCPMEINDRPWQTNKNFLCQVCDCSMGDPTTIKKSKIWVLIQNYVFYTFF